MRAFRARCRETDGFELLLPRAAAGETGAALSAMGALGTDENRAEYERIVRGIPSVPADIGLSDLPNEGGLDEVAISYTKGCYLGQEVMARLKNLGQVRRRLHLVRGQGRPPNVGTGLFQNGRKVGDLRSAARDGTGFVAMAMLSTANLEETGHLSLSPGGPANISISLV
jgi:folate-binding protein YgfZ